MTLKEQNVLRLLNASDTETIELGWELLHSIDALAPLRNRIVPDKTTLAYLETQFFGFNPPPLPEGKWLLFVHELSVHQRDVSFFCLGQFYMLQTDFEVALALRYTINLLVLDLKYIRPTSVWPPLFRLTRLEKLSWENGELSSLPEGINNLTELRSVCFSNNQLHSLPDTFWTLDQLQTLKLDQNQLSALPTALGQLTQLVALELYDNQLQELPDIFAQLPLLEILSVNGNFLAELPLSLFECRALSMFSANHNYLTTLPPTLGQLQQLQSLRLDHNQLQALPDSIGQLTQLQQLYLQENPLPTLPKTLFALKNLDVVEADEQHEAFLKQWSDRYNENF